MRMNTRHMRAWASTTIVMAAILLAVIMANLAASTRHARIDLTFTRAHRLSPRTTQLLDRLGPGYQIVLAVDRAATDQRCFDATLDLLNQMADRTTSLDLRTIDVGSTSGRAQFESLIVELQNRERPLVESQAARFNQSATQLQSNAAVLRQSQATLETLAQSVPGNRPDATDIRSFFAQRAALLGLLADQHEHIASAINTALSTTQPGTLPDTATLRDRVLPELNAIETQLAPVVSQLARFAATDSMPDSHRTESSTSTREIGTILDALRVDIDALTQFRRASVFRVASAIETGEACLVIGPTEAGLTGLDRASIIPSITDPNRSPAEAARHAEDMFTIALASVASHDPPILIIIHAEIEPFVMTTPAFEQFIDRNRLRGVDVVEWPIITQPEHPPLEPLDPDSIRPVVYFAIAPNSAAASVQGDEERAGARRAARLGAVLSTLRDEGAQLAININPSVFPTFGDDDPIASVVAPFGLKPLTGSPLLLSQLGQRGDRHTITAADAVGTGGEQPIAKALAGLSTRMLWPIVIDEEPVPGVETFTLLTVEGGTDRWLESQWIGVWQEASQNTATVNATFDPARDVRRDSYTVARATQRPHPTGTGFQRILCIGSNAWALDRVAQERARLDGRLVPLHPGNLELIDAGVFWLAGQDDMIAQGASTASSPTVSAMEPAIRTRLAWFVLAGLPLGVLALGIGYRICRG